MELQSPTRLEPSSVAARLGLCAAALAGTAATVTDANAVVVVFNNTISIPASTAGVYITLLTGATGSSAGSVAGWDFNPYLANGGTQLGFYWANPTVGTAGGVATSTSGGAYVSLTPGATVSSASTFTQSIVATTSSPFLATGTHILGFKFFNETTSAVNYGYLTMTNTATNGYPATITGWRFENTGAAITVVPEPSTTMMLSLGALALGASNLRKLRRQRRSRVH